MAEFLERSLDCLDQLSLPSLFPDVTDDPVLLAELNGAGCCSVMDGLSPTVGLTDYYFQPFAIDDDCGGEFYGFPPASSAAEPPPLQLPPPPVGSAAEQNQYVDRKRKTIVTLETSSQNCSAVYSAATASAEVKTDKRNNGWKSGKRLKSADLKLGDDEKAGEVVHVRARRGQATDSHSLAERVRRRKINERMRCLQDLVPGCYKTMGMAGVLDQIINYVQSLQNQVEFLSMKLSAANSFYDFNSGVESVPANQAADNSNKANEREMRRLLRARGRGGCDHVASATSTHHQHHRHRHHHHQHNRFTFDS